MGMFSYVLGPFMVPMIEELGWTRSEYTLSRSLGQFVMGFAGFFIGTWVDRFGARPLMVVGTLLLALVLAAHSQVQTLTGWLILNGALLTVGCALVGNLVVNVTMAKWFVEKRGQAVAWAAMGVSFAGVVLTPTATWLADELGWRGAWVVLGVVTLVCLLPAALVMRRTPEDHGWHPDGRSAEQVARGLAVRAQLDYERSLTRAEALRSPSFYLLVLAFGLFTINIVVMLLHTVPYLSDRGFSRSEAAWAITVASIPAMLSKPIWGFFIDRLEPRPLAAAGAALTGLSLLAIVGAVELDALVLIYAAYVLLGIGWGGMIPLQEVIWGSFFGRRYLGAVRSAGLPFALLLGAAAPLLVSYYRDLTGGYRWALVVVACCNLASGVLLATLPSPRRPGMAECAPAASRGGG
ncbi:MAG TPA: MFS transporter [Pseudomonadales bacterium]